MLNSLRFRLILSHLLPLLIILPLMGIALIYVLETQVLLGNLLADLTGQARLMVNIAAGRPDLWTDQAQARFFVAQMDPDVHARFMLFDPQGRLIASNDAADNGRLGQPLEPPGLADARQGRIVTQTVYNRRLSADVVDVLAPVFAPGRQLLGFVRLTHRWTTVLERFVRLRYLISAVLGVSLLLGTGTGWTLALSIERPLTQVTDVVYRLARGELTTPPLDEGPGEIRLLLAAVKTFVDRVKALERERRQLLSNLVHELGRPLGSLRTAVQALQRGATEDASLREELLVGIDGELQRLQRLLDDLAHLQDQVVGRLELARRPTPLGDWLVGVLAAYREAALAKGLLWEARLPVDLPTVNIDPDRLGQALGNLLSNAVKYTEPGGRVCAEAGMQAREAWIRVVDDGPGIDLDEQKLIFTPFYRSKHVRRQPTGTGLGLTIARDLAVAHGGRLEVQSMPGEGSTFTVWLPIES